MSRPRPTTAYNSTVITESSQETSTPNIFFGTIIREGYSKPIKNVITPEDINKRRDECESKKDENICNASGSIKIDEDGNTKRIQKCKWAHHRCFYNPDFNKSLEITKEKINTEVIEYLLKKTTIKQDLDSLVERIETDIQNDSMPEEQIDHPQDLSQYSDIYLIGDLTTLNNLRIHIQRYFFYDNAYYSYETIQGDASRPICKLMFFTINEEIKSSLNTIEFENKPKLFESLNNYNIVIVFYDMREHYDMKETVTGFMLYNESNKKFVLYEKINTVYTENPNADIVIKKSNDYEDTYETLIRYVKNSFTKSIEFTISENKLIQLDNILQLIMKQMEDIKNDKIFFLQNIKSKVEEKYEYKPILGDENTQLLHEIKYEFKKIYPEVNSLFDAIICFCFLLIQDIQNIDDSKLSIEEDNKFSDKSLSLQNLNKTLIMIREFILTHQKVLELIYLKKNNETDKEIQQIILKEKTEKNAELQKENEELSKELTNLNQFIDSQNNLIQSQSTIEKGVEDAIEDIIKIEDKELRDSEYSRLETERANFEESLIKETFTPIVAEIKEKVNEMKGETEKISALLGEIINNNPTDLQDDTTNEYEITNYDENNKSGGFVNNIYSSGSFIITIIMNNLTEYLESFHNFSKQVIDAAKNTTVKININIQYLLNQFLNSTSKIKDIIVGYLDNLYTSFQGPFSYISDFVMNTLPEGLKQIIDVFLYCFKTVKYLFTTIIPYMFSLINTQFPWQTIEYIFSSVISICKTIIDSILNLLYYILIEPMSSILNKVMEGFTILYSKFSIFILSLTAMTQHQFITLRPFFEYWSIQSNLIISSIGESIGNIIINSAEYAGNEARALSDSVGDVVLTGTKATARAIGNAVLSGRHIISDKIVKNQILPFVVMAGLVPTCSFILYNGLIYFARGTMQIAILPENAAQLTIFGNYITGGVFGCLIISVMSGIFALDPNKLENIKEEIKIITSSMSQSLRSSIREGTIEIYNFTTDTIVPLLINLTLSLASGAKLYLGHSVEVGKNIFQEQILPTIVSGAKFSALQMIILLSYGGQLFKKGVITSAEFGFTTAKIGGEITYSYLINMGELGYIYVLPFVVKGVDVFKGAMKNVLKFLASQTYLLCVNLLELIPTFFIITLQTGAICLKFSLQMFALLLKALNNISFMLLKDIKKRLQPKLSTLTKLLTFTKISRSTETSTVTDVLTVLENSIINKIEELKEKIEESIEKISRVIQVARQRANAAMKAGQFRFQVVATFNALEACRQHHGERQVGIAGAVRCSVFEAG
jgi:hypothetical protein